MLFHLYQKASAGPNSFKFYKCWMKCQGYKDIIAASWNTEVQSYPIYRLVHKLKNTKIALKAWASTGLNSPSATVSEIRRNLIIVHEDRDT